MTRMRPSSVTLRTEDKKHAFTWKGDAKTSGEAMQNAKRHARSAWDAITAATGRNGPAPTLTPILGYSSKEDYLGTTTWKIGSAMQAQIEALPKGAAIAIPDTLCSRIASYSQSLVVTDPLIRRSLSNGGRAWGHVGSEGAKTPLKRKIIGQVASDDSAGGTLPDADTVEALMTLATCIAAMGQKPLATMELRKIPSATLAAIARRDALDAAIANLPEIAMILTFTGNAGLAARILHRLKDADAQHAPMVG